MHTNDPEKDGNFPLYSGSDEARSMLCSFSHHAQVDVKIKNCIKIMSF